MTTKFNLPERTQELLHNLNQACDKERNDTLDEIKTYDTVESTSSIFDDFDHIQLVTFAKIAFQSILSENLDDPNSFDDIGQQQLIERLEAKTKDQTQTIDFINEVSDLNVQESTRDRLITKIIDNVVLSI